MTQYQEVINYIEEIPKFTSKHDHLHTKLFLEEMGITMSDIEKVQIIHVAGTNGKGSVCAFLTNILSKAGFTTGLFTSPHLVTMNERIRINQKPCTDAAFITAFDRAMSGVEKLEIQGVEHPSYFEFLFGMAMAVFLKERVDYVILETGLGGRLDATNLIQKPLLSIITSIGLDHMEYLGNSIVDIAREKAGIIKPHTPVVYWGGEAAVQEVIEQVAARQNSLAINVSKKDYKIIKKTRKGVDFCSLCGYYLKSNFRVPFMAEYQVENAMLAIRACEILELQQYMADTELAEALYTTRWEGRMEEIAEGVILDGAHNAPGMDAFVRTVLEYRCDGKKRILFSVVKDKDYDAMVQKLCATGVDTIYITKLHSDRGLDESEIREKFEAYHFQGICQVFPNVEQAYRQAVMDKQEHDVLFCAGSLYLIGEIKALNGHV